MLNPTRRHLLALASALLALTAVACQGDSHTDDTARQIANDELTRMGLAPEDFGADFANFQADANNGLRTLDQVSDDDFDPEDERADLERFNWATQYQGYYTSSQAAKERSGVFVVGSSVNLFETNQGAAGYLDDSRAELQTQVGKTSKGVTVLESREFDADIADGATGAVFHGSVETGQGSSTPFWMSAVMFRHGRLVATVGMYSFEEPQHQDTVKDLASQFDQNISNVLGGATATR